MASDKSNGYEQVADAFVLQRQSPIGVAPVREWAATLPHGAAVLDLGCGLGVPISEALMRDNCTVYGVDAAPRMVAAFRSRFPHVQVVCEAIEDSTFFDRVFDGVVAWGVMFLVPIATQALVMGKVSRALKPGGSFLFTAPRQQCSWPDSLTGRMSISPGVDEYRRMLATEGMKLVRELEDDGENHYYVSLKD